MRKFSQPITPSSPEDLREAIQEKLKETPQEAPELTPESSPKALPKAPIELIPPAQPISAPIPQSLPTQTQEFTGTPLTIEQIFNINLDRLFRHEPEVWHLRDFYHKYKSDSQLVTQFIHRIFFEVQAGGIDEEKAIRLVEIMDDQMGKIPGLLTYLIDNISKFDYYYLISFIRSLGLIRDQLTEVQVRKLFEAFTVKIAGKYDLLSVSGGIGNLFQLDTSSDGHLIKEFLIPIVNNHIDLVWSSSGCPRANS